MADQPDPVLEFPRLHDRYPQLGTGPIPTEPYVSREYFELERERIFRKVWLIVGREEEIPEPGDFLTQDIAVVNASILVVRGSDGRVRSYFNQCSHRSNKVAWEERGNCRLFKCPFHGWIYTAEGELRGIPDEKGFFGLDKSELGLTPIQTDIWGGFIFVNFDPEPEETLAEYLGEFGERLAPYPFAAHAGNMVEWRVEFDSNWKVVKDAFQEPFHLPFVHHRTIGGIYANPSNPHNYVIDCALYPRHHSVSQIGSDRPLEPRGVARIARQFGSEEAQHAASLQVEAGREAAFTPGTNPTRNPYWDVDLHAIFPNVTVNTFAGGRFVINHLWPLAVDRTLWIARAYFPEPANAGERFSLEFNKVFLRDILIEDGSTVEATQKGVSSGAKKFMYLHEQEILVRHDAKVIEDHVGWYRGREAGNA